LLQRLSITVRPTGKAETGAATCNPAAPFWSSVATLAVPHAMSCETKGRDAGIIGIDQGGVLADIEDAAAIWRRS